MALARRLRLGFLLLAGLVLRASVGCGDPPAAGERAIPIGLLLSGSGATGAGKSNFERAVRMVIEAANQAGGVDGRPLTVLEPPISGDPGPAAVRAGQALLDGGVAVTIGPEDAELLGGLQLTSLLSETVMLPSLARESISGGKIHGSGG